MIIVPLKCRPLHSMKKIYSSAPLPFVGQKRNFAKEFKKVLRQFPDGTTFVDLFGGSGLLSHITKHEKPNSKVVYNDFDGYRLRLKHIPQTNKLLAELRIIVRDFPKHKAIIGEARERASGALWLSGFHNHFVLHHVLHEVQTIHCRDAQGGSI